MLVRRSEYLKSHMEDLAAKKRSRSREWSRTGYLGGCQHGHYRHYGDTRPQFQYSLGPVILSCFIRLLRLRR